MTPAEWEEFRQWCIARDIPVDVHLVNHFWKWWRER